MDERTKHYLKLLDFYLEIGEITEETYKNAKTWLTEPEYESWRDQVMALMRPSPLIDAFYQILPFGTGGRRGIVGVGTNRMNARTVGESAQGLADYIREQDRDGSLAARGVVVAHDVRLSSEEFTEITAEVLAASRIKVYLFDGPRSTPLLSFAVRHLQTIAGVVITASHNPPSDNGFKAYWEDGGQVVAPQDQAILEKVRQVRGINRVDLAQAKADGLVELLGDRVDQAYLQMAQREYLFCPERDATIVYSPLHGTGVTIVPAALSGAGFADVHMPAEQTKMDGTFPTVPENYPNPELPVAMGMAVKLGREVNADIVMASDPDADRLGVFVPDREQGFQYITGNAFGAMMLDFVLERRREQRTLPENAYVLTTFVTTGLVRKICQAYGVEVVDDLLVGFKNMAYEMYRREEAGQDASDMVFAFEESIGYMASAHVRDKDSASAALIAAQMAAWCKARGMTLLDRMEQMYEKYGYFKEHQFSVFLHGEAGAEQMRMLMDRLRNQPPKTIAGFPVVAVTDRLLAQRKIMASGEITPVGEIKNNALIFELSDDGLTRLSIRPSGTEPKIKHYLANAGKLKDRKKIDQTVEQLEAETRQIEQDILQAK